jgi:hypothetical protein
LLRFTHAHQLRVVAHDTPWMNDPTSVVIDQRDARRTLYVANGALGGGTANIVRLRPSAAPQ